MSSLESVCIQHVGLANYFINTVQLMQLYKMKQKNVTTVYKYESYNLL